MHMRYASKYFLIAFNLCGMTPGPYAACSSGGILNGWRRVDPSHPPIWGLHVTPFIFSHWNVCRLPGILMHTQLSK